MNQIEIAATVHEVTRKIAEGTETTPEDVSRMEAAARSSGRIEHRALYARVKAMLPESNATPTVTDADVAAARKEAIQRPTAERIAKYVALKRQHEQQAE